MKKTLHIIIIIVVLLALALLALSLQPKAASKTVDESYKTISYGVDGQKYFGNEAVGDLNGDGKDDIAFLITSEPGGSGTFFYVVAALKTDTGYVGTNPILLGDRIAPQNTSIQDGDVVVNFADRKKTDPMSAQPSVGVTSYFKVVDGKLVYEGSR